MCIYNQKKNLASVSSNHGNYVISRFEWRNEKKKELVKLSYSGNQLWVLEGLPRSARPVALYTVIISFTERWGLLWEDIGLSLDVTTMSLRLAIWVYEQEMNLSPLVLVKTKKKLFDLFYSWYPQDCPRSKNQMGCQPRKSFCADSQNQLAKSRPVSFSHLYGNNESASFCFLFIRYSKHCPYAKQKVEILQKP